jgi:undecaprenyl-diphosphatase
MSAVDQRKSAVLLALLSLAVLKVGALAVCPDGRCHALAIDVAVLSTLHTWRSAPLDSFFQIITWAGSLYVLLPLALLLAALERDRMRRCRRWFVVLALLSYWPVIQATKALIARPRPTLFEALTTLPSDPSFPSAHVAQVTVFACAWLMRPAASLRWNTATALVLLVCAVALSRLYLQVHYPSDVVFAVLAGALWVAALRYGVDGR